MLITVNGVMAKYTGKVEIITIGALLFDFAILRCNIKL